MWIQSLTAVVLVATGIALLAMQDQIRAAAGQQLGLRTEGYWYPGSPHMDEVMSSRFTVPAIVYLTLAVVYVGLAIANHRRLAGARIFSWWVGSIAALFGCWWGLGMTWQPTHVTDEIFHLFMGYVDEVTPAWLAAIEFWPQFAILAGFVPVGLLLNAGARAQGKQSRPEED